MAHHGRSLVRAGRFSRVAPLDQEPPQPLTIQQLLVIDLMPAQSLADSRIAKDRIRTIAHSAAFLLVSHLVTATLILFAVIEWSGFSLENWPLLVLVFGLLGLDLGFWMALRNQRMRKLEPRFIVRSAVGYCALAAIIFVGVTGPALRATHGDVIVYVGLAATFILSVPAFLSIPALVLET